MSNPVSEPCDINGQVVKVGDSVRILELSGQWLDNLPENEKHNVLSMVGKVLLVEEIDEYGAPWVTKTWFNEAGDACNSHSIALSKSEMERVNESAL